MHRSAAWNEITRSRQGQEIHRRYRIGWRGRAAILQQPFSVRACTVAAKGTAAPRKRGYAWLTAQVTCERDRDMAGQEHTRQHTDLRRFARRLCNNPMLPQPLPSCGPEHED